VKATEAGQRQSFSLAGPTGPASVSSVVAVHLRQSTQAGSAGPADIAGFLRIGGTDHDGTGQGPGVDAPSIITTTWTTNPDTGAGWTTATLPSEAGLVTS
jgi:hypothetical protein